MLPLTCRPRNSIGPGSGCQTKDANKTATAEFPYAMKWTRGTFMRPHHRLLHNSSFLSGCYHVRNASYWDFHCAEITSTSGCYALEKCLSADGSWLNRHCSQTFHQPANPFASVRFARSGAQVEVLILIRYGHHSDLQRCYVQLRDCIDCHGLFFWGANSRPPDLHHVMGTKTIKARALPRARTLISLSEPHHRATFTEL
jgi:hypothetical protein